MSFERNYATVKNIKYTVENILAEEVIGTTICGVESSMGHQHISNMKINIDDIKTLTPIIINRIVREIDLTVEHISIEEYPEIESVDIDLHFKV